MKSIRSIITPRQKVAIIFCYQFIWRLLKRKPKIITKNRIIEIKTKGSHTFFGYYDLSPINSSNQIIYHELYLKSNQINIVLNDTSQSNKKVVAKSSAWNWQQGSRLRWLNEEEISFNDYVDGKYINRIINVINNNERYVNYPLYDIDKSGNIGVSLDFARLGVKRPGYGYTCTDYKETDMTSQGIDIIDIHSNTIIKRITYVEISSAAESTTSFKDCYINHLSFSPEGNKFLFFWIEIIRGYHKASLLVYDIKSNTIIPLELEGKVSHYVWRDNDTILCTTYSTPVSCSYYLYSVSQRSRLQYCPTSLEEDGHPSYYNENVIITDTYPNKQGYQVIKKVDVLTDESTDLIQIYGIPTETVETRTDLHPRMWKANSSIVFDANPNGCRSLFLLKLR